VKQPPHSVLTKYYATEAERRPFVRALFDEGARHYDFACGLMSLGSGQAYRRYVLRRAGLTRGMRMLDVATGTGLVARAALGIVGDPRSVVGLDPSQGMLQEARKSLPIALVQGQAEDLPFEDGQFDLVTMGFALRHVADLGVAFREFRRVLKPGGRLLVIEISRPPSALGQWCIGTYLQKILPPVLRLTTRSAQPAMLMRYYWDTIADCVPAEAILAVLRESGFTRVERRAPGGVFSEYLGTR
jgi:demethylmenaquinone methyltransferase/2-methoxy-6-polyprenyl-1,4-benzoquinol methylase